MIVPTRPAEGCCLDPTDVEAAIDERTVELVINSPNNPTGAVQSEDDLRAIAALAEAHDLLDRDGRYLQLHSLR